MNYVVSNFLEKIMNGNFVSITEVHLQRLGLSYY